MRCLSLVRSNRLNRAKQHHDNALTEREPEMRSIKFHYENAGGFGSKAERVKTEFTNIDRDVMGFTESWLNNTHLNSEFFPEDIFQIFRRDRTHKGGGGVLIAVRASLNCEQVFFRNHDQIECECIKIKSPTSFIYVYVGYIPPNSDVSVYRDHNEAINSIDLNENDKMLVLGDYNLPGIEWIWDDELGSFLPTNFNYEPANHFLNEMTDSGFFQMCDITNKSGNVLDLVFTTDLCSIALQFAPASLTAAAENSSLNERIHYPMEWELEIEHFTNQAAQPKKGKIKCFKKANF